MADLFTANREARIDRTLAAAAAVTTSPFTGQSQVLDYGGRWWDYKVSLGPYRPAQAKAVVGFFTSLGGPVGTFLFADPTARNPAAGSPVVDGSGQSGNTLVTAGWTPSATVLEAGRFFSLGTDETTRLYMVTADVVSDGTGAATLTFTPELRISPSDTDALEVENPKVLLRLVSEVPSAIVSGAYYSFSFSAREAI